MKRIDLFTTKLVKETTNLYGFEGKVIRSSYDACELGANVFDLRNAKNAKFCLFALSTKNQILGAHVIYESEHDDYINSLNVSLSDIFTSAIVNNACSIVTVHNQPNTGNDIPNAIITLVREIKQAGQAIGIELLDHVYINSHISNDVSLKEEGYV